MKRLLLDTHTFIWALIDSPELGERARELIINPDNQVYVSAVSVLEAGIKNALGKWHVPPDLDSAITEIGAVELPITAFHSKQSALLPLHHKDPFDRLLIAQAQAEGLILLSADTVFPSYGIALINARK